LGDYGALKKKRGKGRNGKRGKGVGGMWNAATASNPSKSRKQKNCKE